MLDNRRHLQRTAQLLYMGTRYDYQAQYRKSIIKERENEYYLKAQGLYKEEN